MYENLDNRDKCVGKKDTPIENHVLFSISFDIR